MAFEFLQGRIEFLAEVDEALLRELCGELNQACRKIFAGSVASRERLSKMHAPDWLRKLAAEDAGLAGMTSDQRASAFRRAADLRATARAAAKFAKKNLQSLVSDLAQRIAKKDAELRKARAKALKGPQPSAFAKAGKKPKGSRRTPEDFLAKSKERLARLRGRLARLERTIEEGRESLCFGSGRLLSQREAAGKEGSPFASAAAWKEEWDRKRSWAWMFEGKANAASRNPLAKFDAESGILRVRLTEAMAERRMAEAAQGLGVELSAFKSSMKHSPARMACRYLSMRLASGSGKGQAARLAKLSAMLGLSSDDKAARPVSWRVMAERDRKGKVVWSAKASWETDAPAAATSRNAGALGVDLNARSAAWAFVDADGNSRSKKKCRKAGKAPWFGLLAVDWGKGASSGKTLHEARRLACELVAMAEARGRPICLEALDFSKKKLSLRCEDPEHAALLSGFAYSKFREAVLSRAERRGVEVIWAEPSWSSVSGFFKYAALGAGPDEAAAVAIARAALLARPDETRVVVLSGETYAASVRKERLPRFLRERIAKDAAATAAKAARRASKAAGSQPPQSTTQTAAATANSTVSATTATQPGSNSGAARRSTPALFGEWKPGSAILGSSRKLWRAKLACFSATARREDAERRRPPAMDPASCGSGGASVEDSSLPEERVLGGPPPSTRFVNG